MNKQVICVFVSVIFVLCSPSHAVIENPNTVPVDDYPPFKEGRILVKSMPTTLDETLAALEGQIGVHAVEKFPLVPGLRLYELSEYVSIPEAIDAFTRSGLVEYAEPDYLMTVATEKDPRIDEQWALDNVAQTGGLNDADINAPAMWSINNGDPSVVIGVIDTGIDYHHPDLVANLWRNSGEIPGDGIDQDRNGYVDDVFGINAITNNGNPLDDNKHGTHVAGTIGAVSNNGVGVAGVMHNVRIAACKFLAGSGSGSTSDAIQCLQYFANLKARAQDPVNIVATNNSWGSTGRSSALEDAVRAHLDLNILFVAAAGNAAVNTDVISYFPAGYQLSNVMAVAATDHNDRLASFSNYGHRSVHVSAPGVRILSTVLNQTYALLSGTSMAAPHVTGLAGIIKAQFAEYDFRAIKNLIIASGTPLPQLNSKTIAGRRLRGADTNGQGALSCTDQVVRTRLRPFGDAVNIAVGDTIFLSAMHINCAQPAGEITLLKNEIESVVLSDAGSNGDAVADDGTYSVVWKPQNAGSYALDFGNGDVLSVTVAETPPAYRAHAATRGGIVSILERSSRLRLSAVE